MDSSVLPLEIVLLICQELAARRDFNTLFYYSLTSPRITGIALQQIYSIHELSAASAGEATSLELSRLWRSIILSSVGKTLYPYCAYVRALSLGNLEECLQDVARYKEVRDFFFQGDMEQFLVLRDGHESYRPRRGLSGPPIDAPAIILKCTDSITKYIRKLADENGTAVALAHLEGTFIPHDLLPTWIARLGTLTSLRIRDGSVLGAEAASAISEHCPNFVDLTCYYCMFPDDSSTADEDLAAFFLTLPHNTLRSFQIISQNGIGEKTLTALNVHAKSLHTLKLGSLPPQAMKALNMLPDCIALETLAIENDRHHRIDLKDFSERMLKEVSSWISSCTSLRDLSFNHVLNALSLVKDTLSSPKIRLTSLSIVDFLSRATEDDDAVYAALGLQVHLENLTIGLEDGHPDNLIVETVPALENSICQLKNLTSLNLMQSFLRPRGIKLFARKLPKLSEFSFGGEMVDDGILGPLGSHPSLSLLSINALSAFSWAGLRSFAEALEATNHKGIRVDILNQIGDLNFTDDEYNWLTRFFTEILKGRIEITYFNDPDEVHEDDFTDVSD
ncbi:uncharacterized protein F4822DRAFT_423815 [Hypoxylon trugodes]|uniref:uncharacterized protein n=1 Tax=Hypoxylon trugodes TaxID=326681 RepID=UPI00219D2A15|nr:uncharacterized protein F4822DRAFT_423815 [Hypoxylon trugodes]KAI1393344.1 hypothetical protein F4822DRAFT_423815 [Hypoxylon trugodes]